MAAKTGVKQDLQRLVTEHVQNNPGPFTALGVATALGRSQGSVRTWLDHLWRRERVHRSRRGIGFVYTKTGGK